eukprot:CAMPEP_0180127838 /NCGR_PEP_ID=MMETSP0986-20121125/6438_1 /TAXON_ID=697907 /ORGANISM="non described non described, Strain CCMP2293" /LENGTH=122 /DNA_ID=CAMNT_0022067351 /DNA_START=31 /DNA_END=396 /DNA_ORIENTATION=-
MTSRAPREAVHSQPARARPNRYHSLDGTPDQVLRALPGRGMRKFVAVMRILANIESVSSSVPALNVVGAGARTAATLGASGGVAAGGRTLPGPASAPSGETLPGNASLRVRAEAGEIGWTKE